MTQLPDSDETPSWSLAEHLENGVIAVARISSDKRNVEPHPVCHHFWAFSKDEDEFDETISGRRFASLVSEFDKLGLEFDAGGLEAWETIVPTEKWLASRVPPLFTLAESVGFSGYSGWTWEPRAGQPIGACEFQVISKRTQATD